MLFAAFKKSDFWLKFFLSLVAVGLLAIIIWSQRQANQTVLQSKKVFWASAVKQANQQSNVVAATSSPVLTSIIFGGDVMLSRVVGQQMQKFQDYSWPLQKIAGQLAANDLTVVNLESPFAEQGPYFVPTGSFAFRADPKAVQTLLAAGVDVVSLANNHALNAGRDNLLFSKKFLTSNGIAAIGGGANLTLASEPAVMARQGVRFAFLAYAYPRDNTIATADQAGIAFMDPQQLIKDIKKAKQQADVVIVLMHAGEEYTVKPNSQQEEFAHLAIKNGASLVIGHHAHWPQQVEVIKNESGACQGVIVYGLGNLVFDQMWSKETQQGVLVQTLWQKDKLKELEFLPIRILNYGQTSFATSTVDISAVQDKLGLGKLLIDCQ
jgi:poly-gamma-glutamate synthesis protein (capsule biosynthesis protein)